jgi:hypothetical protein
MAGYRTAGGLACLALDLEDKRLWEAEARQEWMDRL